MFLSIFIGNGERLECINTVCGKYYLIYIKRMGKVGVGGASKVCIAEVFSNVMSIFDFKIQSSRSETSHDVILQESSCETYFGPSSFLFVCLKYTLGLLKISQGCAWRQ